MSRANLIYDRLPSAPTIDRGALYAADEPIAGYYRKRRRDAVWRPIAIWHGPPLDPWDGTELDRSWRWICLFAGRHIDLATVWPDCQKNPIDRAEYEYLLARIDHAARHDPTDPYGHKSGSIDWLTAPPPF